MILRDLQKYGHRPIVLIGDRTSKVGNPSGKDDSRLLLNDEMVKVNTNGISGSEVPSLSPRKLVTSTNTVVRDFNVEIITSCWKLLIYATKQCTSSN